MKSSIFTSANLVALLFAPGLQAQTPEHLQRSGQAPSSTLWPPSGSTNTTCCTPRSRSTTSPSVPAAASASSPMERTVDFGETDGPMNDQQLNDSKIKPIYHLPLALGGVVPIYNLPVTGLKFSGETLADIYLGKVVMWDDPAIAKDNPGVKLPSEPITVVHRADGSGTTYTWVDFLSKVVPRVQEEGGRGHFRHLAGGPGRQGQRGGLRPGAPDPRLHRLRGADLRAAEQDRLRPGEERRGRIRERLPGLGLRRGRHRPDPRGLPGLHHQRPGQGRLSHLHLHLDPGLPGPAGRRQEEGPA